MWFGRDNDCLAFGQDGRSWSCVWITGAQVALFMVERHAFEKALGVSGGDPSALFCDADRHYLEFRFVDGVKNRRGR